MLKTKFYLQIIWQKFELTLIWLAKKSLLQLKGYYLHVIFYHDCIVTSGKLDKYWKPMEWQW